MPPAPRPGPTSRRRSGHSRAGAIRWNDAIALLARLVAERRFTKVSFLNAHNANPPMLTQLCRSSTTSCPAGRRRCRCGGELLGAVPDNLNGTDLIPAFLQARAAADGAAGCDAGQRRSGVDQLAALAVQHSFVVIHDGYFYADEEIVERIASLRSDVLLVAMGVPRQELWIARNIDARHCTCRRRRRAVDFLSAGAARLHGCAGSGWNGCFACGPNRAASGAATWSATLCSCGYRQKFSRKSEPGGENSGRTDPRCRTRYPSASADHRGRDRQLCAGFRALPSLCETIDRHASEWRAIMFLSSIATWRCFASWKTAAAPSSRADPPRWLHALDDPLSLFRRRIWLSLKTIPCAAGMCSNCGIAIAAHARKMLIFCDPTWPS
jgi:hypothetical protein